MVCLVELIFPDPPARERLDLRRLAARDDFCPGLLGAPAAEAAAVLTQCAVA